MEKQAFHAEWGRLKVSGRPLLTGATAGRSQLMLVACRTSPCLVHLFEDSNLVWIWRFPADPVFLLLGPAFRHQHVESIAGESKSSDSSSLLVITSDGRVWLLHYCKQYAFAKERFTEKKKEAVPEQLQKAVQEMLDGSDIRSLYGEKSFQSKLGDNLQSNATHGSQKSGLLYRGGAPNKRDEALVNPVGLDSVWKKVSGKTFERVDNKFKPKMVSEDEFLCYVPGTLAAAWGPNDTVALLGVSGTPKLVRVGSSGLPPHTFVESGIVNGHSFLGRESSCFLVASMMASAQDNADEQPEGHVTPLFQEKLFKKLFDCSETSSATSGILHGDSRGNLYTSLISPELEPFQTKLLCDFGQPIMAAFAIPATAASLKRDKSGSQEDHQTRKLHGCFLLLIGQLGKVILITGVKETGMQADNGPFWPPSRSFSWSCKNNSLTTTQLSERSLSFHEWEVFSPVTTACMLGPYRLCYCTRSEVFYTDLLENDEVQIYPHQRKTSAEPKDPVSLSLLKLSQKLQSSASDDFSRELQFKKELSSQKVSLGDPVLAVVGKGVSVRVGASSRPLVALTARGRLLSVEVSNHVSSRAVGVAEGIPKSWRSAVSRMEAKIQDLLRVVGEAADSTRVIKNHSSAINLALKELSGALLLAREISLYKMTVRRSDTSLVGERPAGKISSCVTVTDHTPVLVSPEILSFGPKSGRRLPVSSFHSRKVKIAMKLCNQSRHFLSPHWSLLLELRPGNSAQSVQVSFPINAGLGLPVGAEFMHEFVAQIPGKGLGPISLCVFLCHHQNYHHLIAQAEPHEKGVDPSSRKLGDISSNSGSLELSRSSGSVSVVLSRYRIDLLSLSEVTAPRLGIDTRVHFSGPDGRANWDVSAVNEDLSLGKFSSRLTLGSVRSTPSVETKDISRLLPELYLDDLLKRGVPSKDGQRISISVYDTGTASVSFSVGKDGGDCTVVEIALESSSLLLGSYLREALLWRLDHCKDIFILKECYPWQQTANVRTRARDADKYGGIDSPGERSEQSPAESLPGNAMDAVMEITDRLPVISELWKDVIKSPERAELSSLLKETHAAMRDVMLVYKSCREGG
ncbi:hypothetical protein R1sor_010233 [Riccia sorocarpa]|uniref:Uncharacterized protein n=1 Tax=Riccia sorocarpa TaxID=122646 RepID=A0ABD3I048_9MARC